jgi:uncharacterized membrane protein (GlpM family)
MTITHALLGFLVGQIITVEGVRLDRVVQSLLGLFLIGLFVIFPTFAMITMIYSFQLEKSPLTLVCVCVFFSHIMIQFLNRVAKSMRLPQQ